MESVKVLLNLLQLPLQAGYHFTVPGNLRCCRSTLSHSLTHPQPSYQEAQTLTSLWAFLRCASKSEVTLFSPANVLSLSST